MATIGSVAFIRQILYFFFFYSHVKYLSSVMFIAHALTFCPPGNTFYLVMPTEPGESATDDLSGPRVPPPPPEEGTSPRTQPEEETPAPEEEPGQSGAVRREGDEEAGPSQAGPQSHVIRNVDEIFHTIEGLMSKLRQLRVRLFRFSATTDPPPVLFSHVSSKSGVVFRSLHRKSRSPIKSF